MLTFKKVTTGEEIKETAQLAHNIWNQHFVSIIGQAQTDYMLENFQSENAMAKQIDILVYAKKKIILYFYLNFI